MRCSHKFHKNCHGKNAVCGKCHHLIESNFLLIFRINEIKQ